MMKKISRFGHISPQEYDCQVHLVQPEEQEETVSLILTKNVLIVWHLKAS